MKSSLVNIGLALTVILASAAPSRASALLAFSYSGAAGGSISTSGTTLTALSGVPLNQLVISGAPSDNGSYTGLSLTEAFNTSTDVLTITTNAAIASLGVLSGTILESVQYSGLPTISDNGTSGTLTWANTATSVSESVTLLNSLGLNPSTSVTNGGGITLSGNPNNSGNYHTSSDTYSVTVTAAATPEPVSFLLFGSGLLAIALFARRKSAQVRG